MSYSYFEIYYNYEIPIWERVGLAALTPLLPILVPLTFCKEPDREKDLPPVGEDAVTEIAEVETPAPDVCEPEKCDGFIDKSRTNGDKYLCISFNDPEGLAGLESGYKHTGLEVADINGDGFDDIYLLNQGAPNQAFINTGAYFQDASEETGLGVGGDSRSAAFADYDGDGDLDMLLTGDSGSRVYGNHNGVFTPEAEGANIKDTNPGRAAVWLGSNILLGTENGTRFYRRLENGSFVDETAQSGLSDPGSGSAFALNGADIYLANITGKNRFFVDQENGTYVSSEDKLNLKSEYGQSTDAEWVKLHTSDDDPAIFVSNWDAANQLFVLQTLQDGQRKYFDVAGDVGLQDPGNTTCARWGDFLNEGAPALFLCRYDQMNLLYLPEDNANSYLNIAYPSGMAITDKTVDAAWLDYDKDGMLDLVTVVEDGAIHLHRNVSHWVSKCK